ncbi:MAG: SpoIID/LytB domain-containing protein [Bdellovibrionales bacterium]
MRYLLVLLVSCFVATELLAHSVRVRLLKRQSTIVLNVKNASLSDCPSLRYCSTLKIPDGSIELKFSSPSKLSWKNKWSRSSSFYLKADKIFHNSKKVPSLLKFTPKMSQFDLIGVLGIEDYLAGVLPAEMPASWPVESLKAQAVASRSYVLSQIRNNRHLHFDVESDVMDQVYRKMQPENPYYKKIRKVVADTKGLVIGNRGSVLKAYFHSHCGGHTEQSHKVWPGALGFENVQDPYCVSRGQFRWKLDMDYDKLSSVYRNSGGSIQDSKINKLLPGSRNSSGRLENVFVFFDNGKIRRWSATKLRQAVGFSKLRSTKFDVSDSKKGILLTGKGYGHGVGMCQHGARAMAQKGYNYTKILKHYYPYGKLAQWNQLSDKQIAKH